jgi:hypothetical protein
MFPLHTLTSYFYKLHFNIVVLPYTYEIIQEADNSWFGKTTHDAPNSSFIGRAWKTAASADVNLSGFTAIAIFSLNHNATPEQFHLISDGRTEVEMQVRTDQDRQEVQTWILSASGPSATNEDSSISSCNEIQVSPTKHLHHIGPMSTLSPILGLTRWKSPYKYWHQCGAWKGTAARKRNPYKHAVERQKWQRE